MLKTCNTNYELNKTITFALSKNVDKQPFEGRCGGKIPNEPSYKAKLVGGGNDYCEYLFPLHYLNPSWFSIDQVLSIHLEN